MKENNSEQAKIRFGRFCVKLPGTRLQRIILGVALCIGGVLGFLPVVGFWMLPLGLLVLSVEFHVIRRFRRRFEVWCGRRRRKKTAQNRR